jgi:hypothetical protein
MAARKVWRLVACSHGVPWGDYGDVLYHGLLERNDTELLRCGKYIPPVSLPGGALICAEAAKIALEEVVGKLFRQINRLYLKCPEDDWREWADLLVPDSGEPEDLVAEAERVIERPALWIAQPQDRIVPVGVPGTWQLSAHKEQALQQPRMWRFSNSSLIALDSVARDVLTALDVDHVIDYEEHVVLGDG